MYVAFGAVRGSMGAAHSEVFFPLARRQTGARRARSVAPAAARRSAEAAMDRSLHPARPQNQTLVLSNHLVITTVEFLNKFAEECDAKLCKLHQKMQRLEIEVKLLEIKLSSIPGAQPPG